MLALALQVKVATTDITIPPVYSLQVENQVEKGYLNKPMIVGTVITKDPPKLVRRTGTSNLEYSITGYSGEQCVQYARRISGIYVHGWAINNPTNASEPEPGIVMKTSESSAGHVAVVQSVTDTTVTISEANYSPGLITQRTLNRDDPRILGYIR